MAPPWLLATLTQVRRYVVARRARFTLKALGELTGLGLDVEDAIRIVAGLSTVDFARRVMSRHTGEWMYVFKPAVAGTVLYVKLLMRTECVIISFHEDEEQSDENDV